MHFVYVDPGLHVHVKPILPVRNHAQIHTYRHIFIHKSMLCNIPKQHHTSHTPLPDQSMQGSRPRANNNAQAPQLNQELVDMCASIRLGRISL